MLLKNSSSFVKEASSIKKKLHVHNTIIYQRIYKHIIYI